jgi:hypothetical protein
MMMRLVLTAAAVTAIFAASPARADFAKGQELMILTLRSALLAEQYCPYKIDDKRLQVFLARKNLTRASLSDGQYSPLLQEDIAADAQRYQTDTAAACDQAWASFGPGSPLSGLLRAK